MTRIVFAFKLLSVTILIVIALKWTDVYSKIIPTSTRNSAMPTKSQRYQTQHDSRHEKIPHKNHKIERRNYQIPNHGLPTASSKPKILTNSPGYKIPNKGQEHNSGIKGPDTRIKDENKHVEILEWVCIPPLVGKIKNRCDSNLHRPLEKYHARGNTTKKIYNTDVLFKAQPIPDDYTIKWNHTAIIYGYTEKYYPTNFFHYVTQYFFPFHYFLDFWRKSNLTKNVNIYFSKPLGDECSGRNYSTFFFETLPETKATEQYSYNYNIHPGKVCYRYGLFSDEKENSHAKDAVELVRHHYGIDETICPRNSVTLLQRSTTRKWLNIEEVKQAMISAGYVNTTVVDFEKIPLRGQLQVMYCTDVFFAVHSAAVQWSYFMNLTSTAVEISFPEFGWRFLYSRHASPTHHAIPINFLQLETRNVTNYEESVFQRIKIGRFTAKDSEQLKTLKGKERVKAITRLELGKACNFNVDPKDVLNNVKKLRPLS